MDWGLASGRHRRFHAWFYPVAVAANGLLRLGWAVYISPDQVIVEQHVILLLGVAEVSRRFLWALLRVENEAAKMEAARGYCTVNTLHA